MITGVFVLGLACSASADIIHVDDDAPPGGDGLTWETAFRFLQDGLARSEAEDEIRIGQGSYYPDRDELHPDGTGDREACFEVVNLVAMKGGYAGYGADDPDARDIELFRTILSGDLLGDDGPGFENYDENSLHVVGGGGATDTTLLEGLEITGGNAKGQGDRGKGGGVYGGGPGLLIMKCIIRGNRANDGGGATNLQGTLVDCAIVGNQATSYIGGALANWGSGLTTAINCTFSGNSAGTGGGAIFLSWSDLNATNCIITNNVVYDQYPNGSTILLSGANLVLTNCTLAENDSPGVKGYHGGEHECWVDIKNSILWNEGVEVAGDQCHFNIDCSDVEGGYEGYGNIDFDPMFVDPENGDFRLQAGSPCTDAGANTALPLDTFDVDEDGNTIERFPLDLDGNPRFVDDPDREDTGLGTPPIVDMGAYEIQSASCAADIDDDGDVGTSDLLALLGAWGECPPPCPWDFNGDGVVDDLDQELLWDHWGPCPDPPDECPWDLDGDGDVDYGDVGILLDHYGPCPPESDCPSDLSGDEVTDTSDLLMLLASWGECPRPLCPWDFNGDEVVDDLDADILVEHWGDCPDPPEECPWDLNGDGVVDIYDIAELLERYGQCP
jgi:hypothetical protein